MNDPCEYAGHGCVLAVAPRPSPSTKHTEGGIGILSLNTTITRVQSIFLQRRNMSFIPLLCFFLTCNSCDLHITLNLLTQPLFDAALRVATSHQSQRYQSMGSQVGIAPSVLLTMIKRVITLVLHRRDTWQRIRAL